MARLTKKQKQENRNRAGGPKCQPGDPCPGLPEADPYKWTHPFETTYKGTYFDTETCSVCGFEVKSRPI